MADNVTLPATGSVVASDDVGGVQFQKFKLDIGGDGISTPLSADNPVPVGISGDVVDYYPTYGSAEGSAGTLARATFDPDLNLRTRSAVLTDEGTFRVNFANASLSVALGSVTISGNIVTGTGFDAGDVHKGDYFKLDADGQTAWTIIDSVDSDTQLTLLAAYVGGSSGAASRALMRGIVGTGGTISVASGQCTIASGTTASSVTKIDRDIDVAPLVFRSRFNISQRIANHTTRAGMTEASSDTDRWFARFVFDGTTATLAKCETGRNPTTTPSASETETTTFTLPNNKTTATMADYRVEMLTESVRFYVDGVIVAEHTKVIPSQHDPMDCLIASINGATPPATTTSIVLDYVTGKNHNKLEIGVMSDAEKIVAVEPPIAPINYSQAGVITINTDLLIIDCSQYRALLLQCSSMGTTGVITPAWSDDGVTYVNTSIMSIAGAAASTFNAAGMWTVPVLGRYFRLRLTTATTAGTTTLVVNGIQSPIGPNIVQPVSGTVTANIGTGSIAAGTNAIGDVGIQYRANATGAATIRHIVSAATTNATSAKASAGRVVGWNLCNTTASFQYVKLHNIASAPTAGSGVVMTIAIPPNGVNAMPVGGGGIGFATGIGYTIVTGSADADATATTAGSVVGDLFYA